MRHSSSEADGYRGDHGPDANSVGKLRGCAPRPRRSGQSADYYPLIAQAVNRLEQSTVDTRRTIYDRARAAMVAQLRSLTPPLRESDINLEQLALDRAIRKVETQSLCRSATPPQPSIRQSDPSPQPIRETGDKQAEMSNESDVLWQNATRPRSLFVILANDGRKYGDDSSSVTKLAIEHPDLSAELEILQKEIRRRNRRGSPMILPARKLVSLTVMGLLVLSIAASGAY
jgi:hypothetical protein